jgi:hypothetical protein
MDMERKEYLLKDELVLLKDDNQVCFMIARNPEYYRCTKAIDVHYHYVRNLITRGIVMPDYVSTEYMLVDSLIKALPKYRLEAHK